MKKNYITALIKTFPNISSGRKHFDFYEWRIMHNIKLTKIYLNRKANKFLK